MSEQPKQPWAMLIIVLIASIIGWLTVSSRAMEDTSAPQNLILTLSKMGVAGSLLWISLIAVSRLWKSLK
jgi:hypothetical protein